MENVWGDPTVVKRSLHEVVPRELRAAKPRYWWVTYPEVDVKVKITIGEVAGLPEIVGLAIEPLGTDGKSQRVLTADLLRRLPIRKLKRACLSDGLDEEARHFLAVAAEPQRPGRVPIERDLLRRVAETYRSARKAGMATAREIARVERVSPKTAEKYIRRARDEKLLEEPSKRKEKP
ncbi:MAG: hypothetical protein ACYDHU_09480 [Acidimicrobiales bacterium]